MKEKSMQPSKRKKYIFIFSGAVLLTGQYAAVDGFLTGRENLELIAALRHVSSPKTVAKNLLAKFDRLDSGSMRRRLDIAMSLKS